MTDSEITQNVFYFSPIRFSGEMFEPLAGHHGGHQWVAPRPQNPFSYQVDL